LAAGITPLNRIVICTIATCPFPCCRIGSDIITGEPIRVWTVIIAGRGKRTGIAPITIIAVGAIRPNPPFILGAGIHAGHADPGVVAGAGKVIPISTGISPLYGVTRGPVTGSPLPGG